MLTEPYRVCYIRSVYETVHSVVAGRLRPSVVAIAASAGGVEALSRFVSLLPADFPAPVLIVQHLARNRHSRLREVLQRCTSLTVNWAEESVAPIPGAVYLAPPNRHMSLQIDGRLSISAEPLVQGFRPAANVLFRSVAARVGDRAIGIVLTGCLSDGAEGAEAIRNAGGRVFVQHPDSCQHSSMPLATMQTGAVDFCLSLPVLAAIITAITMAPGASSLFEVGEAYRRVIAEQARSHPGRFYSLPAHRFGSALNRLRQRR